MALVLYLGLLQFLCSVDRTLERTEILTGECGCYITGIRVLSALNHGAQLLSRADNDQQSPQRQAILSKPILGLLLEVC